LGYNRSQAFNGQIKNPKAGSMSFSLPSRFHTTFRALRHRNYRIWFYGQTVSLVGVWMQGMALQVLVYRLTGSAAALGMVNFIALVPLIPLSLVGGSLTDRFPRRDIVLWMQVLMMAQALLLAALTWTGSIQVWHIYLLSLVLGMVNAIDVPARQAFTLDLVEGKEDLTNAIGLNSAMFNAARAIGPAMAGIVVAATGEAVAFLINGFTFLAVIVSLMMMRNLPAVARPDPGKVDLRKHMLGGLRFIAGRRDVFYLVCLIAVSAFLSMPYNTLMPVFASDVLGGSAQPVIQFVCETGPLPIHCRAPEALPLGMLLTTVGIGALFGALTVASLPAEARRGHLMTLGNMAFPLLLLAFSLSRSFLFSLVVLFFTGISFVWQNALANTLLQIASPDELRGRVLSVYTMVFQAMMRMGGLQAGLVADWVSAPFSVAIGAAASLGYALFVAIRVPEVRKMK
jgi:MFS family permease